MLYLQSILDSLEVLETKLEAARLKYNDDIRQIRSAYVEKSQVMRDEQTGLKQLFVSKLKTLSPVTVYLVNEGFSHYYALSYDQQRHLVKEKFWSKPDCCVTRYVSANPFWLADGLKEVTEEEFTKLLQEKKITY